MISVLSALFIIGIFQILLPKTPLRHYSIPVSLVASVLFLLVLNLFPVLRQTEVVAYWREMPAVMIALVFACLFLEKKEADAIILDFKEVAMQGLFVWIAVLGQIILGILLFVLLLRVFSDLPVITGLLIETGFAGGHGTAAAMGEIFSRNGLVHGQDFGLFSATSGILGGTVLGLFFLQREGYLLKSQERKNQKVIRENVVKFTNQLLVSSVLIGVVYFSGVLMQQYLLAELPLFVYTLLASILLKYWLHFIGMEGLIYVKTIESLNLVFAEILIFTGIATIELTVIYSHMAELLLLSLVGFAWSIFAVKKIFPFLVQQRYSRELGMLNFGMLTGTTATGIMFLKIMDPEIKGDALKIYGKAAPLSSPFIGGGILTLSLPWLLSSYSVWLVLGCLVAAWLLLFLMAFLLKKLDKTA